MLSVCPYFHVHQPWRIKPYRVFDIGEDHNYFNDESDNDYNNRKVIEKVARKSYLPANEKLLSLLNQHPEFRFAFSFSGVLIDQLEKNAPDTLDSFKRLIDTGRVEVLADTYYHSLAFFYSRKEFEEQVRHHDDTMMKHFGQRPKVFRNTELSYNNELGKWAEQSGYIGIMAEGWDPILGWRSPNFLYQPPGCSNIKVLLKNYRLSDDIAFRFSEQSWKEWPLDANKFSRWIESIHGNGETVNLFMDYETFGEHQWEHSGIFNFLDALPGELLRHPDTTFKTPTETIKAYESVGEFDVPHILTWADTDRDLTAWVGNDIQQSAIRAVYDLEEPVRLTRDKTILEDWRKLQTSDHFYYMCTKWFADGDVHAYFSPYESPYVAYIAFMNVLHDLQLRIQDKQSRRNKFLQIFFQYWNRLLNRFKFST